MKEEQTPHNDFNDLNHFQAINDICRELGGTPEWWSLLAFNFGLPVQAAEESEDSNEVV